MDGPGRPVDEVRVQSLALEALRTALASPDEQRLYRSGKLPGLFAVRTGAHGAAAQLLLRERLVEVVRREDKGRVTFEWVKVTPAGVDYLHSHESPRAVLSELREALAVTRSGVPVWLDELREELNEVGSRLASEVAAMTNKLDALARRVDDALRRADAAGPGWISAGTDEVPWALPALAHLDRRRESGLPGECPLPELFAAVRRREPELTLPAFHEGLRHMAQTKALRLTPFAGDVGRIPEPEYAMPAGTLLLYYASR